MKKEHWWGFNHVPMGTAPTTGAWLKVEMSGVAPESEKHPVKKSTCVSGLSPATRARFTAPPPASVFGRSYWQLTLVDIFTLPPSACSRILFQGSRQPVKLTRLRELEVRTYYRLQLRVVDFLPDHSTNQSTHSCLFVPPSKLFHSLRGCSLAHYQPQPPVVVLVVVEAFVHEVFAVCLMITTLLACGCGCLICIRSSSRASFTALNAANFFVASGSLLRSGCMVKASSLKSFGTRACSSLKRCCASWGVLQLFTTWIPFGPMPNSSARC